VVEGYMDAIMCHQHGIRNVVAPLGTALTAGHLKKLFRQAGDLVLVFDGDAAGIGAARRSLDLIMEQNMRARVMMLPEGEDPDSLLRAEGPERMREMMKSAASPVRFMLETLPHPKGVNEAVELMAKAGDPILRDELILELSDRSRISEQAIREKLLRFKKTGSHVPKRASGRVHTEETLLLSAAVAEPPVAVEIARRVAFDEFADPVVRGLLERIAEKAEQETVDPLGIAESEEERSLISGLAVAPGFEEDDINKVVEDCIRGIARKKMDREIKEAEHSGDMKLLNTLLAERRKLMQETQ
jgi:DNA primase